MHRTLILTTIASAILTACGGGQSSSTIPSSTTHPAPSVTPSPTPKPDVDSRLGVWLAPAYGYALQISRENERFHLHRYDYTRNECLLSESRQLESSELIQILKPNASLQSAEYREQGQLLSLGVDFSSASQLPAICTTQRLVTQEEVGFQPDFSRNLKLVWQTFADYYHDFGISKVDWNLAKPSANQLQLKNEAELFSAACALVEPLQDGHVSVFFGDDSCTTTRKPMLSTLLQQEYISAQGWQQPFTKVQQEALQQYAEQGLKLRYELPSNGYARSGSESQSGNHQLNWFVTAEGYAYLGVLQFSGFSADETLASDVAALESALDEVFIDIIGSKGLIIDVRYNPGGYDEAALRLVRRLLTQRTELYRKQARLGESRTPLRTVSIDPVAQPYRQPIVVLTSNSTFSAAEVFALSMRNRPNTVLIGEATGGALSDTLSKRSTGGLKFTLSNEFYISPQGEWFEGRGVPVNIVANIPSKKDVASQFDPGMQKALQWLSSAK
jgi:carboxyl-terminal processing protease